MADKAIPELVAADKITATDLFVLQQDGTAKKLPGQVLLNWLTKAADGHGGIQSYALLKTEGLVKTYRFTLADQTYMDIEVVDGRAIESIDQTEAKGLTRTYTITFNDATTQKFIITDGRGILSVEKTGTEGLTDIYTVTYNDGTTGELRITNGAKGDPGDTPHIWIRYASQMPTEESHSFGEVPDNWIGICTNFLTTAPEDWQEYDWFQWKGEKGDTGDPATLSSSSVTYQVGESNTVIPSGAWSTVIPAVPPGKYLWTRSVIQFNTGDPIISYSVARSGIDGTGAVSTINEIPPDENGNVPLTAENVGALPITGGTMQGPVNMDGQSLTGLSTPTANDQAANMGFVNQQMRKAAPRNMLDNSDFTNPVNQRNAGDGDYSWGYAIDRWLFDGSDFKIGDNGITIPPGGSIAQRIPIEIAEKLELVTFAVTLSDDKTILTERKTTADGVTINAGYNTSATWFEVKVSNTSTADITVKHCALYDGKYDAETLPQYQPKGYGTELAECQRYFQRYMSNGAGYTNMFYGIITNGLKQLAVNVHLAVPMRIRPTLTHTADGIAVRGSQGYCPEATYSTPYADYSITLYSYDDNATMCLQLTKNDGSDWGNMITNSPAVVAFVSSDPHYMDWSADL